MSTPDEHPLDVAELRADHELIEALRRGERPDRDPPGELNHMLAAWRAETRGEPVMDFTTSAQRASGAERRRKRVESKFGTDAGDYVIEYRTPRPSAGVWREKHTLRTNGKNVTSARRALREAGYQVTDTRQAGGFLGWLFS